MPNTVPTLPSFTMRPGVSCPDWSVVQSPVVKDALLAMFEPEHILSRWSGYAALRGSRPHDGASSLRRARSGADR